MKIDVVTCSCEGELLRFEIYDLDNRGVPEVDISMWQVGAFQDNRTPFWHRVKNAWREFRGKLNHDNICITSKEKLVEMRDIVEELIERWEDIETRRKK